MDIIGTLREYIMNPVLFKYLLVATGSASSVFFITVLFTSILHIYYVISVALAFEITQIWTYVAHDRWTFADVPRSTKGIIRFIKYNLFAAMGLGVNEIVLVFFTEKIGYPYYISEFIAIIAAFFFNYITQKKIAWKS